MKVRTNTQADDRRINHNQALAVAAVGVITLLIGSIISCVYDDIKKALAVRWLFGLDRSSGQLYERACAPASSPVALANLRTVEQKQGRAGQGYRTTDVWQQADRRTEPATEEPPDLHQFGTSTTTNDYGHPRT